MKLFGINIGQGNSLKDKLYWLITGFMTQCGFMLWGGGSSGPSNTTSYSTNLPEYAKPYYEELLKQTGKQVYQTDASGNVTGVKEYTPYGGARLAGFTPGQERVQMETAGLTTPGQFAGARAGLETGQGLGYGASAAGLSQAFGYDPRAITEQTVGSRTFGRDDAAHYMSPYQQNVTDIALREARRQGAMELNKLSQGAAMRGTFGGARNALLTAEANRNLAQNIGDIQAKGSQSAYEAAMQQFNADQARRQQAALANQQANLEAQKSTEQGRQYQAGIGKDIGLAGLTAGLQGSQALGQLGTAEQAANLDRLRAQAASAAEPQAMKQKELDLAYQQFMEKQNYQKQQMEYLSNILRGNASALGSTQTQYNAPPSVASQIGGLGLAGLGLYKALS